MSSPFEEIYLLDFQVKFGLDSLYSNSSLLISQMTSGLCLIEGSPLVVEVYHKFLLVVVDRKLVEDGASFNWIAHELKPFVQQSSRILVLSVQ